MRGNVPTRVRKLFQLNADGLIVAKAAIDRLLEAEQDEFAATRAELRSTLSQCLWMVLPLSANPSAPAQGALAIEIARSRPELHELLAAINCADTFASVAREREILRGYGGGCHQKIGVSVLRRAFGEVTFLRGTTDDGTLDTCLLKSSKPGPPQMPKDQLWPLKSSDADWFARERIQAAAKPTSALWVAKAEALPNDWQVAAGQIVWASGTQTWQRLAQRGVWVNGCAESLGEHESPNIETLVGGELNWRKLTHADGYADGSMPTIATYRLVANKSQLKLEGKTHFFWKSGSSFEYALSLNPWLRQMTHSCGPGNTQRILERNGVQPHIFLNHAQWLGEMSQNQER